MTDDSAGTGVSQHHRDRTPKIERQRVSKLANVSAVM